MTSIAEFLGAAREDDGRWRFAFGRELHGAFGGAFGGVVAAAAVRTSRSHAEGRVPVALDMRFLRRLPAGTATASGTVLHAGRTLSCVSIDICQEGGRPSARATITLVDPDALAPVTKDGDRPRVPPYSEGRAWPPVGAPIIETLSPATVPWPGGAHALSIRLPWDMTDGDTSAEAACLPADMAVGPPVVFGVAAEHGLAHPNPDLSLRFAAPVTSDELVGVGRLERVHAGLATVGVEVWSTSGLVAVGVSTSTLLARSTG